MKDELYGLVDEYIDKLFIGEDEALKYTEQSIIKADMPQISVSPAQGKLLYILAKLSKASRILEVGTLAGYSTIWMARALPKDGKLITLEYELKHAAVAKDNIKHAGLENLVEIRTGKAIDLLPAIEKESSGPFDMIFIDADKEPYAEYFQWALKLSRPGTLIIADNVIREGKVLNSEHTDPRVRGVQRLNKMLAAEPAITATILQTVGAKDHDGMAIIIVD